ncbi:MAG: hypothetical protein WCJ66_02485 [Verrucomicrobiota bacterium]
MNRLASLTALIFSATLADFAENSMVNGKDLEPFLNGLLTVDVTDASSVTAKMGVIAMQLHAGDPMSV